jgi:hypothetical protein
MKKTLYITSIITVIAVSSLLISSCDKKTTVAPDHNVMVTMTYSPNPATAKTAIQFNFSVMDNNTAADVTEINCVMMQGSTTLNPMAITRSGTGMYMGSYTFAKTDSCKITFNYNHGGEMMMQDFMIAVK